MKATVFLAETFKMIILRWVKNLAAVKTTNILTYLLYAKSAIGHAATEFFQNMLFSFFVLERFSYSTVLS